MARNNFETGRTAAAYETPNRCLVDNVAAAARAFAVAPFTDSETGRAR